MNSASERRNGVEVSYGADATRIRLDRPPVNAFTVQTLQDFAAAIADPQTGARPVLIAGAADIFSAGFDIKNAAADSPSADALARQCVAAVQDHPGLTVAAVEGAAVGLGLLIAASADVLVVAKSARLRMPEVTLGIASDVEPLRRLLPEPWIRRLCLAGEIFTAEQMHLDRVGVVLCDSGDTVMRAEDLIAATSGFDGRALHETKRRLRA